MAVGYTRSDDRAIRAITAVTVRPIRYLGDPVLRRPAKKVRRVDDSIRRLIDEMFESMVAAEGVGLAAPQIGVGLRIVVIGLPDEEPFAIINPTIVRRYGERRLEEGCLSVPGYRGSLTRSIKVTAKGLNVEGRELRVKAEEDLLAQVLEHETDHVNGVLYVDRLDSPNDLVKLNAHDHAPRDANDEESAAEAPVAAESEA